MDFFGLNIGFWFPALFLGACGVYGLLGAVRGAVSGLQGERVPFQRDCARQCGGCDQLWLGEVSLYI